MSEEVLKKYIIENIENLFRDYYVKDKESIVKYSKKSFGKIDILLKQKDKNQFIIVELKYNNTNEEAITKLNKYFIYFIQKHKLKPSNVRRVLIDFEISKELKLLCKYSNIECKIISKNIYEDWSKKLLKKDRSIEEDILELLTSSSKPISTRDIALKIKRAWHSVQGHCFRLQLAGKINGYRISNLNVWEIKK